MNIIKLTVTGIIFLAFTINMIGAAQEDSINELVDDIEEYNGSIGPDNALYGLKLAFEGLDESFTFNQTEKLEKKIFHSRLRISEAKAELKKNNDEGAMKAFDHYEEKVKETEESISENEDDDSGIFRAQKIILKHQYILERLLESHPNNTGLLNAYNNSIELEDRFEEKTTRKLEKIRTNEGKHYLRELKSIENELKVEAKITGNNTQVKIELKFISTAVDNDSIADEILDKIRLNKENITNLIKIEKSDEEKLRSSLEAKAEVGSNVSKVEAEYRFVLNETNSTEIINEIYKKLLNLKSEQILDVIEMKSIERIGSEEDDHEMDKSDDNLDKIEDRSERYENEQKSGMEEKKDIDDDEPERREHNRTEKD